MAKRVTRRTSAATISAATAASSACGTTGETIVQRRRPSGGVALKIQAPHQQVLRDRVPGGEQTGERDQDVGELRPPRMIFAAAADGNGGIHYRSNRADHTQKAEDLEDT